MSAAGSGASENVVVTVVGLDKPGVVAKVTTAIAELQGNIANISQTLAGDYFAIVLVVEISNVPVEFRQFKSKLEALGETIGVQLIVQHENTFRFMHRV